MCSIIAIVHVRVHVRALAPVRILSHSQTECNPASSATTRSSSETRLARSPCPTPTTLLISDIQSRLPTRQTLSSSSGQVARIGSYVLEQQSCSTTMAHRGPRRELQLRRRLARLHQITVHVRAPAPLMTTVVREALVVPEGSQVGMDVQELTVSMVSMASQADVSVAAPRASLSSTQALQPPITLQFKCHAGPRALS